MNFLLTLRKIKFSSYLMRRLKKLTPMLMVRNAITIIRQIITIITIIRQVITIITITKNNNKIIPSSKSQISSSSNQRLLPRIIITIILTIIVHTPIPTITITSRMAMVAKNMTSISIMQIALTGILMIMKMKQRRRKKRKNAIMIIHPIIIIIIQRYRREISKANTLITMLIQKVSAKHSQQCSFKIKRTLNTKIQLNNSLCISL